MANSQELLYSGGQYDTARKMKFEKSQPDCSFTVILQCCLHQNITFLDYFGSIMWLVSPLQDFSLAQTYLLIMRKREN